MPDGRNLMPVAFLRRLNVASLILSVLIAGCARGGTTPGSGEASSLVGAVASYDVVANRPGRFMVGLYTVDQTRLLAFGVLTFRFSYLGAGDESPQPEVSVGPVDAVFLPIPGQELDTDAVGPKLVTGSEATGVYGAPHVEFDRPGFWEVEIEAEIEGRIQNATAAFEVLATSDLPAVGEQPPLTRQPLAGDPDPDPKSIDSRAGADLPIPDPDLHDITIADAIAAGRPLMVVVSTPTFCISRFCGPITDTVNDLALEYGDRMELIHLEVWQDFQANILNPAAAEWIAPTPQTDAAEPWVFVIDADGIIVQRFDNVATEAELLAAVEALVGESTGG